MLLLSMLFVQYGVAVHASEHMFHEHEEACDIYLSAERSTHAAMPAVISLPVNAQHPFFDVVALRQTCDCDQPRPQSRAPPAILS